jgi:hypothetical protein
MAKIKRRSNLRSNGRETALISFGFRRWLRSPYLGIKNAQPSPLGWPKNHGFPSFGCAEGYVSHKPRTTAHIQSPTASKGQRRMPTSGRANNDGILYAGAKHQHIRASANGWAHQANRRYYWASLAEASQIQ